MNTIFEVEVFDGKIGDTNLDATKLFTNYAQARAYAKKMGEKYKDQEHISVLLYIPKNDGFMDYFIRQDWTFGIHRKCDDVELY